jgi:hypothetical protein
MDLSLINKRSSPVVRFERISASWNRKGEPILGVDVRPEDGPEAGPPGKEGSTLKV